MQSLLGLHRCQRYDIAVVDERGMMEAHPGAGEGGRENKEMDRLLAVLLRGA